MDCKKISDHIVNWLKDYATNAGSKGFVIGVSGGIDSAVVSTLCAKTGLPILCVTMPIHQNPDHTNRAEEHINFLFKNYKNIDYQNHDLTTTFNSFSKYRLGLNMYDKNTDLDFHYANARARLRMTTLYLYAGISGYLVAGTGNKVEDFGIGFFTKYGDGGVDLSPIGDLYKSEVYKLAKYLGIPDSIQNAVPTDGLFGDTRSDEDQIGATYDELEWAMSESGKYKFSPDTYTERQKEVRAIYNKRHSANAHKMQMPPICELKKIK